MKKLWILGLSLMGMSSYSMDNDEMVNKKQAILRQDKQGAYALKQRFNTFITQCLNPNTPYESLKSEYTFLKTQDTRPELRDFAFEAWNRYKDQEEEVTIGKAQKCFEGGDLSHSEYIVKKIISSKNHQHIQDQEYYDSQLLMGNIFLAKDKIDSSQKRFIQVADQNMFPEIARQAHGSLHQIYSQKDKERSEYYGMQVLQATKPGGEDTLFYSVLLNMLAMTSFKQIPEKEQYRKYFTQLLQYNDQENEEGFHVKAQYHYARFLKSLQNYKGALENLQLSIEQTDLPEHKWNALILRSKIHLIQKNYAAAKKDIQVVRKEAQEDDALHKEYQNMVESLTKQLLECKVASYIP